MTASVAQKALDANWKFQQNIVHMCSRLEEQLCDIQVQIHEIESLLRARTKASELKLINFDNRFHPYFRDKMTMTPPQNKNSKAICNLRVPCLLNEPRLLKWHGFVKQREACIVASITRQIEEIEHETISRKSKRRQRAALDVVTGSPRFQGLSTEGLLKWYLETHRNADQFYVHIDAWPIDWQRVASEFSKSFDRYNLSPLGYQKLFFHCLQPKRMSFREDVLPESAQQLLQELLLLRPKQALSGNDWEQIAFELNEKAKGRPFVYTPFQCFRSHTFYHSRKFSKWTEELDKRFLDAMKELDLVNLPPAYLGKIPWIAVQSLTGIPCAKLKHRWPVINPLTAHGFFTQDEDLLIIRGVLIHGAKNWTRIAASVPGRNSHQVRNRYIAVLHPQVKTGNFSPDEDQRLLFAVDFFRTFCPKTPMSTLSPLFPGRSDRHLRDRLLWLRKSENRKIHKEQRLSDADKHKLYNVAAESLGISCPKLWVQEKYSQDLEKFFNSLPKDVRKRLLTGIQNLRTSSPAKVLTTLNMDDGALPLRIPHDVEPELCEALSCHMDKEAKDRLSNHAQVVSSLCFNLISHGEKPLPPMTCSLSGFAELLTKTLTLKKQAEPVVAQFPIPADQSDEHVIDRELNTVDATEEKLVVHPSTFWNEFSSCDEDFEKLGSVLRSFFLWPAILSESRDCNID